MQYSFKALALLTIAGLAAAQDLSLIPDCAQNCIKKAGAALGCGATDYHCLCDNQAKLTATAGPCILTESGCPDIQKVIDGAKAFCSSLPPKSSSAAAPVESSTAAPVESSSAAPVESSSAPVESTTEAAAPVTTTTSAATYPTSTGVVTSAPDGTAAPTGSPPTSSVSPFTGGAAQAGAGVGSFFAAGMAVLAAF